MSVHRFKVRHHYKNCGSIWDKEIWSPNSWESFQHTTFPLPPHPCPGCQDRLTTRNLSRWVVAAGRNAGSLDSYNAGAKAGLWSHTDTLRHLPTIQQAHHQDKARIATSSAHDYKNPFQKYHLGIGSRGLSCHRCGSIHITRLPTGSVICDSCGNHS